MNPRSDYWWGVWLSVLSLDVTAPFLDEMKVPVPEAYFTGSMRIRIREHRAMTVHQELSPNAALVSVVLSDLDRLAPPCRSDFERWYVDVATVGWDERPFWAPWRVVLRDWAGGPGPARLVGQRWFREMINLYLRITALPELLASTVTARTAPLSEWDAEMFALHRFYEIEEEDEGFDPFIPVRNTIEFVRLRRFHSKIKQTLTGPQASELLAAACETAARIDFPLDAAFVSFKELPDR